MIESFDPSRGGRQVECRTDPGEDAARRGGIEVERLAAAEGGPGLSRAYPRRGRRLADRRRVGGGEREVVNARPLPTVHARVTGLEEGEGAPADGEHRNLAAGSGDVGAREIERVAEDLGGLGDIPGNRGYVGDVVGDHVVPPSCMRVPRARSRRRMPESRTP